MSTAEQLWPRNSLLEWKDWATFAIPFTHVVYSTGGSRNPPRDTFGGKHCLGLLKMSTAEQLWPRNSLLEWKNWANTVIPFTHVVYSTGRSRNPPRETFGGKHCFQGVAENEYSRTALTSKFSLGMERLSHFCNSLYTCSILNRRIPQPPERHFWGQTLLSGVAENEYSRTALASKFSLGMEKLSKYCNSLYNVVYSTRRSRNPPRDTFGGKHCFPGVAENEYSRTALASKFSFGMERLSNYSNSLYTCTYTQQDDPATPRETLLGANIAFWGLLKMSTAEQLWPRNSLLEWKDWANTVIPLTHVVYLTRRSRNPPTQ